jgi:hypothetical protein
MSNDTAKPAHHDDYVGAREDSHLTPEHVREVKPSALGCEDCLKIGASWVHLRICTECGHVGCCDESPHRHATQHFRHARHPIIRSFEPGEVWGWCYADRQFFESMGKPANTYGRHFG